jgi:hypothetical protein
MGELAENVSEAVEAAESNHSKLNTAVAALVAVSATFMALCNVKDGNVVQAMAQAQARSVDQWTYYQAKGTKQNLAEAIADQLRVERDASGAASPEVRALYDKKIGEQEAKAKRYEEEKAEIKKAAEGYEKQYDDLNVHDDQFDMAEAGISIGIALFGVTSLTQKRWLLFVGLAFAGGGTLLGLAGFLGWSIHPDWVAKLLG